MQKKSVKKNRRRANQTRRRKSIMRGGNKNVYIAILIALLALLALNKKPFDAAPSATDPSATAPSATAPSATAPSATTPSATAPFSAYMIDRYKWNDTEFSNPVWKGGPERNSKIHALRYQQETNRKILDNSLSLETKVFEINNFLKAINENKYPKELARTNTIMTFCVDNKKLCKELQEKYPWFNKFMDRFIIIHGDDYVPSKTCDNNDINLILSRIISEDNFVTPGNLDKVAKEIAFATASNLVNKNKAKTKTEKKIKEEKKEEFARNIFEQLQTCGYHVYNNYFRLNENCCFTEPPYKGGSVSDITIKDGEIVHTNNVNEKKLNAEIKKIDLNSLESLTTEQLMEQIKKITIENNITIFEEDNGITIHSNN